MKAKAGDRLTITGHRAGEAATHAEILEVRGENGEPPFYVRWPDGHESLVFPGSDMIVEHRPKATAKH